MGTTVIEHNIICRASDTDNCEEIPRSVIEHIFRNADVIDNGADVSIVKLILDNVGFFRALKRMELKEKGAPLDMVLLALVSGIIRKLPTVSRIAGAVAESLLGAAVLDLVDGDDKYYRDLERLKDPVGLAIVDECTLTARRRFRHSFDQYTTYVDIDGQFVPSGSERNPLMAKGFNPTNPREKKGIKEAVFHCRDGVGTIVLPTRGNNVDDAAVLGSIEAVMAMATFREERESQRQVVIVGDRIFYRAPVMNAIRKAGCSFLIAVKMAQVHRDIALRLKPEMEHVCTLTEDRVEHGITRTRHYEVRGGVFEEYPMTKYKGKTPLRIYFYHDEHRAANERAKRDRDICKLLGKDDVKLVAEVKQHLAKRYGKTAFDLEITPKVYREVARIEEEAQYDGLFGFISDREWDLFDALEAYRGREGVENANKTSLRVFHLRPVYLQIKERLEGFNALVSIAHLILAVYRHCFRKFHIADEALADELMRFRSVLLSYGSVEVRRVSSENERNEVMNTLVEQMKPG